MSDNILQLDAKDLKNNFEQILFDDLTSVEVHILDVKEYPVKDGKAAQIGLKCKVLSNQHKGKTLMLYISKDMANSYKKRVFLSFAKAFFTEEQLLKGTASLGDILLHKMEMVAEEKREFNGKMYQSFHSFKDLGELLTPTEEKKEEKKAAPKEPDEIPF